MLLQSTDQRLPALAQLGELEVDTLHAVERVFGETAARGEDVGDQADQEDLDAEDEGEHGGKSGRQVPGEGAVPVEVFVEGPVNQQPEDAPHADQQENAGDVGEDLERLVENPDAHDGGA